MASSQTDDGMLAVTWVERVLMEGQVSEHWLQVKLRWEFVKAFSVTLGPFWLEDAVVGLGGEPGDGIVGLGAAESKLSAGSRHRVHSDLTTLRPYTGRRTTRPFSSAGGATAWHDEVIGMSFVDATV